ncbi:class I SAM-dependent methyltransferase [Helicobacter himalayensis]|uniref:class I SAM-dependent methyltransferase n=1 Tax=Helicobacter himalayensis TaxID=1591088 RepID=UPI00082B7B08|nr:class I SAM-dependent methyltransferase [Helicobacter himalayensis]
MRGGGNKIQITHIEPYPSRLLSLLRPHERKNITLYAKGLQEIPLSLFESLESGDVLFVDSSHVCKANSDVNLLFFEILPRLQNGVYIHFHDIIYPFDYPKEWLLERRGWNEAYMLRTFLEFNPNFKIVFFSSMLGMLYPQKLIDSLPHCQNLFWE